MPEVDSGTVYQNAGYHIPPPTAPPKRKIVQSQPSAPQMSVTDLFSSSSYIALYTLFSSDSSPLYAVQKLHNLERNQFINI
jgi:hypothetical protein